MTEATFVKCNTCGGIYRPVLADGSAYYHACPPTRVKTPAVVDAKTGDVITPAQLEQLPNRRNENVCVDRESGAVSLISEGLGVTPVTDAATVAALTAAQGV